MVNGKQSLVPEVDIKFLDYVTVNSQSKYSP